MISRIMRHFLQNHPHVVIFSLHGRCQTMVLCKLGHLRWNINTMKHIPASMYGLSITPFLCRQGRRASILTADAELSPEKTSNFFTWTYSRPWLFQCGISVLPGDTEAVAGKRSAMHGFIICRSRKATAAGICKKAAKNLVRYGGEVPNVTVLEQYPTVILK